MWRSMGDAPLWIGLQTSVLHAWSVKYLVVSGDYSNEGTIGR